MTLFDPLSSVGKYAPFGGTGPKTAGSRPIWGKVIWNEDPRMLGRIKVAFDELLPWPDREGDEHGKEVLPWMYPLYPAGLGQSPLTGSMCVPEEETFVYCIFPYNSIYFGYYVWQSNDRLRRSTDYLSEYPERYGWQDSRENKEIINKDPSIDTIEHRFADAGLSIYDSNQNRFTFKDDKGTQILIDRDDQYASIQFAGIQIQLRSGKLTIQGLHIDLRAKVSAVFSGLKNVTIIGDVISKVASIMGSKDPNRIKNE